MGANEEVVSDGVFQIKDCPFNLNLSNALSTKAVARSSLVHFENLLYELQKFSGPTMFDRAMKDCL